MRWFLIAFLAYCATVYGTRIRWRALIYCSGPHHHAAQALAWLNGRLHLDPNCGLPDLSPVDGLPYSSFPPGPTILMFVPVAIFGGRLPDMLFHCLLAATSVTFMHLAMPAVARRTRTPVSAETLEWLTAFYALGTIIWLNVPFRGVWFMAHWVSLAALPLAIFLAARGSRFGAGAAWAFAFASRPPCIGALPALVYLLYDSFVAEPSTRRRLMAVARFLAVPTIIMVFWLMLNAAQFGGPFDFGRGRMLTPYADRLAKGVFSPVFLVDNVKAHFLNFYRLVNVPPYLVSRHEGTSLFLTTPGFFCLVAAFRRGPKFGFFWLAAWLTLVPLLLHHANEAGPAGSRHLLDVYPIFFVLMMMGFGPRPPWWAKFLIAVDIAYTFAWVWFWLLR
ncbi:MAG: hypothetical protein JXQ73_04480 [Phycisphaerae bacterium]|nr:hypothetical protein [Phycisphaerae bacterium]